MAIKPIGPPYRGQGGDFLSKSLFREMLNTTPIDLRIYEPVFSLYGTYEGMINCQATFVALGDPTGYKWAMQYLGSWNHWERLMKSSWFVEAYEVWIKELNAKIKSEAVTKIKELVNGDSPAQALAAAKFLAEEGWSKAKHGRGRPSKEELSRELKEQARKLDVEDEDMVRIGLKVINGGKSA